MEEGYLPTKTNLMKIKSSLKLSSQGHELLEKKKLVLIKEKEKYKNEKEKLEIKLKLLFQDAYKLLQNANVDLGIDSILKIANGIKKDNDIDIKYKTIMGVEIPSIAYKIENNNNLLNYGFYNTTVSLDKAVLKFNELKMVVIRYTEIDNTINRLNKAIVKVQTRSNALKNIIIPRDEKVVKQIQEVLDEKEREEFIRLKIIKNKINH